MEREGLVDKVDLGDGKAHFELREDHHEHIKCDSCGRVVGVPGCILENAASAVASDTGFTVTSHQLLFSGICPDCATAARLSVGITAQRIEAMHDRPRRGV